MPNSVIRVVRPAGVSPLVSAGGQLAVRVTREGPQGPVGATGPGVAAGGSTHMVLRKSSGSDYATEWHDLTGDYRPLSTRILATSNVTAALGQTIAADTTGGTFTVTIPPASDGKGTVTVKWVAGTVAPTIALSGSDHVNTSGGVTSFTPALLNQGYQLESDGTSIWTVVGDDLPLSQLIRLTHAIAGWAVAGAFALSGSQTYDATYGVLTGATLVWPDGATGVFASTGIDTTSTNPGGLTGFTATHVLSGTTLTATVVIPRNGSGQVSGAMTVTVA